MVDISAHGARAPRPPGPDRGADVIDDRDRGRPGAHSARDAMGEFRAVDDHQDVGLGGDDRVGRLADAREDFRQALRDAGKAHDCQIAERKRARHPLLRHMRAADTGKAGAALRRAFERGNECGAEPVARFLACHQKNMRRARTGHRAGPTAMPTTKILARSAAATRASASATIVSPAATATPASPAPTAPSTVFGPIEGRSKRRSC